MQTETARRRCPTIKVYCLLQEHTQLQVNAAATGLSLSTYLRQVGLGYRPQSLLDHHRVLDLAKVNGDLGRLGGLLKLWLTDDERTKNVSPALIRTLLRQIEARQEELRAIMKGVVQL